MVAIANSVIVYKVSCCSPSIVIMVKLILKTEHEIFLEHPF